MTNDSRVFRSVKLALGLGLALAATGCEALDKFNPFDQPKKPLSGTRQPVFPTGVPGVDYGTPLGQPSNANVSVDQLPPPPQGGQQQR
ncbi:hypothetical protein V5F34_06875 [Xanthobacter autotrophicus]|jgi:hypothetical protein|uniref:Lipoprotein n=1 Tax=Xanthobacter autotrophicus TaxID=280 RepID=A0A6C1KD96_XANAU|nr:hypothetical protein [Xanthobacter autotrophicus]TLX41214.1 hypothetical protein FBQ73_20020 [Xanthobacter autotrophicus]